MTATARGAGGLSKWRRKRGGAHPAGHAPVCVCVCVHDLESNVDSADFTTIN